jgi:hypothetical protein
MRGIEVLFALAGFMATAFGMARGIEYLVYGPEDAPKTPCQTRRLAQPSEPTAKAPPQGRGSKPAL